MKSTLLKFLAQFNMLTETEMQLIADHTNIRHFKEGSLLLREGEIANSCYLVLKGCVRQYIVKEGHDKTTAFYTEYQPVNLFTSASNNTKSAYNLICMEDCVLTVSSESHVDMMCRLIPRLESIIRKEVEKNSGVYQDEITKFISSTAEERYLDLMKNRPDLLQRVSQHYIASYIGVTPQSLSRIRKRLVEQVNI